MVLSDVEERRKREINFLKTSRSWLPELEGLRGLAALWVFTLHVSNLTGADLPVFKAGGLGVDLFILLSGFLMVHQHEQRPIPIQHFYLRRFFRIAPLYYILLAVSLAAGDFLQSARAAIPYPEALTDAARYTDHSAANVLTHVSFAFGLLPHYSSRTAMPDWSIGLEMQFYLVFPLLMLLILRVGYAAVAITVCVLAAVGAVCRPHWYASFSFPSFLPLKIDLFVVGMLIAARMHGTAKWVLPLVIALPILALVGPQEPRHVLAEIAFALLLYSVTVTSWPLRHALKHPVCVWLGDISYSFYLLHLLVLVPVVAFLVHYPAFLQASRGSRFAVALIASAALIVPLSWLCYRVIERPGIALGKSLLAMGRRQCPG